MYSKGQIYKIVNLSSSDPEKIYVGSTTNFLRVKFQQHKKCWNNGEKLKLYRAFTRYGIDSFKILLLENYPCNSKTELDNKAEEWRIKLKAKYNALYTEKEKKEKTKENLNFREKCEEPIKNIDISYKYKCEKCRYNTNNKSNYTAHLKSFIHISKNTIEIEDPNWVSLKPLNLSKYDISRDGNIRNHLTKYILKYTIRNDGYKSVTLIDDNNKSKTYPIHRLLALTFLENNDPKKCTVDHIDRVRDNNELSNLRWVNHKEQRLNQNRKETCINGGRKVAQIDKEGNVLKIFETASSAEKELGCCRDGISAACRGKRKTCKGYSWKYIEDDTIENEVWKPLAIDNNNILVSDHGRVKKGNRILKGYFREKLYQSVKIGGKQYMVHRLVMYAFEGVKEDPVVNHKNGIKHDNRLVNLEYCTPSENSIHAIKTGLNPLSKKKVGQYDKEGNFIREYKSIIEASKFLKVNRTCISMCCNGKIKTSGGFIFKFL